MKLLFAPFSIVSGWLAGLVGRKLFERAWALIDDSDPPLPKQRSAGWPKLLAALLLEGAVFRVVRGAVDHAARRGFSVLTGSWPGEQEDSEH